MGWMRDFNTRGITQKEKDKWPIHLKQKDWANLQTSEQYTIDRDTSEDVPEAIRRMSCDELEHMLDRLPPVEADIIEMYFIKGKTQGEMAEIWECFQGSISYRMNRALERIKWMLEMPEVDLEEATKDITAILHNVPSYRNRAAESARAVAQVIVTTSQTTKNADGSYKNHRQTAFCAYRHIIRAAKENSKYEPYAKILKALVEDHRWNILSYVASGPTNNLKCGAERRTVKYTPKMKIPYAERGSWRERQKAKKLASGV